MLDETCPRERQQPLQVLTCQDGAHAAASRRPLKAALSLQQLQDRYRPKSMQLVLPCWKHTMKAACMVIYSSFSGSATERNRSSGGRCISDALEAFVSALTQPLKDVYNSCAEGK